MKKEMLLVVFGRFIGQANSADTLRISVYFMELKDDMVRLIPVLRTGTNKCYCIFGSMMTSVKEVFCWCWFVSLLATLLRKFLMEF